MLRDFVEALGRLGGRLGWVHAACTGLAAAFLLAAATPTTQAAVSASGDVAPFVEDEELGIFVPDLPFGGGMVNDPVIVGGAGLPDSDTEIGSVFIDAPAVTAPLVSVSLTIGNTATSAGIVQITSAGSQWRVIQGPEGVIVGKEGQGTLALVNGGQLTDDPAASVVNSDLEVIVGQLTGSQGFIDARGTASLLRSRDLTIGDEGFGLMTVTTGARIETLEDAVIGAVGTGLDIGTGSVTVDGFFSRWTIGSTTASSATGSLIVGRAGRGGLTITNRGEVRVTNANQTDGDVTIGDEATALGEVTVNGQFSQLWAFGTIFISDAQNGRGFVSVQNLGVVRANEGVVISPNGVLELAGGSVFTPNTPQGTVTNRGVIRTAVGGFGQIDSIVNNESLGEIRSAGTADRVRERLLFTRAVNNRPGGLISSIGGEMEFAAAVVNEGAGTIAGRDAVYRFRGGLTNNGTLGVSVGATDIFGAVVNTGIIGVANQSQATFYNLVTNSGELSVLPGGSAIFMQDFNLSASSVLNIHLNEVANVAQLAQIDVFGDMPLDGRLNIFAGTGLNPQPGDSYQIISGSNITGMFDVVVFPPALANNWTITYNPESVVINFVDAPRFNADFNNDNVIDAADLAIIRMNFGLTPATQMQGDADGDGDVDGNDMQIWQQTLGPVLVAPAAAAVPEPGSLVMLLSALALVARPRRRVKR